MWIYVRMPMMRSMSAETVGRHMPSVVTLDDLAAMIAADEHGHRYEISPEAALSVMPPPVTLYRLDQTGEYVVATKVPLSWLLNTAPSDHLD
jgi:hypothetical protein